jgi:hypothetical protein
MIRIISARIITPNIRANWGKTGTLTNLRALQPLHRIVHWYSVDSLNTAMSDRRHQTRAKNAGIFMDLAG